MEKNFKKYLESKGRSKQSIDKYYSHLIEFIHWCENQQIEPEQATYTEVLSYIQNLQKRGIKQRTIQVYLNSLQHYFIWLVKLDIRADYPTKNIKIQGVKRQHLYDLFKKTELETIYENIKIPEEENLCQLTTKRDKVIFGLMIWQGIGSYELARIQTEDLKLREGIIQIPGGRKSNPRTLKLEAPQMLDMMEYTLQIRNELLKLNHKTSQCLIVSSGTSDKVGNILQQLFRKLKVQNPRVKSLKQIRASVITYWLRNHNLREVQYMAGHRFVSSTESYLINDLDDLQEDISKYHPI
jgi:integrase/recombinase XerD